MSSSVVPATEETSAIIIAQQCILSRSAWFNRGRRRESDRPKMKLAVRTGLGEWGMMLKLDLTT